MVDGATSRPTAEEQKTIVKELEQSVPMKAGDTHYLIWRNWYKSWKDYVVFDLTLIPKELPPPGPIDNTQIMEEYKGEMILKRRLYEGHDFVTVSEPIWN